MSIFLKAGTVLIPKPEWVEFYRGMKWPQYVVTSEDEKQNATIGERWMIKTENMSNSEIKTEHETKALEIVGAFMPHSKDVIGGNMNFGPMASIKKMNAKACAKIAVQGTIASYEKVFSGVEQFPKSFLDELNFQHAVLEAIDEV